ncbi:MAG: hypothetical protein C5B55_09340 [Blastocatellia bacterium]|nr:MAG: hypothetical protein C5B55_09340 [Blastocatellia bacterium]
MTLFPLQLRVSYCGPLFARFGDVQRSYNKFWEPGGEKFVRYIKRSSQNLNKLEMSNKKTIRIVKKGDQARPAAKPKANSAREAAREMVGTVTNWVNEFQQKRRTETTNALRILSKTPRGSEA